MTTTHARFTRLVACVRMSSPDITFLVSEEGVVGLWLYRGGREYFLSSVTDHTMWISVGVGPGIFFAAEDAVAEIRRRTSR